MFNSEDRALLHAIARALNLDIMIGIASLNKENQIMATLEDLTATAEKTESTMDSAIVVIKGIAARIAAAGVDPVKLQTIVDGLNGRAEALAFAIDADQAPASDGGAPVVPPSTPN